MIVKCDWCGKEKGIRGKAQKAAKHHFCSFACRSAWRGVHMTGENHPRWTPDVPRQKACQHCGKTFGWSGQPLGSWLKRKFCSRECILAGQRRLYGPDNPRYTAEARRRVRAGKHGSWARAVIGRDKASCQHCGATGVELHAHHIKSYEEFPELRWEPSNGLTLCHRCHWTIHSALNANGVNSGNTLPGEAGGNPEPSFGRKPVEGVTTSGRAYRRWDGHCEECGAAISKRWSDVAGKAHLFCSGSCRSKFFRSNGINGRRPRQ